MEYYEYAVDWCFGVGCRCHPVLRLRVERGFGQIIRHSLELSWTDHAVTHFFWRRGL